MNLLATGDWLTRDRVTTFALASAVCTLAMLVILLATSNGTVDALGRPLGTDFSVFWNAGRMANAGNAVAAWDPVQLNAAARATHGGSIDASAWLYPPVFLFVASALAALPYVSALILWQAGCLVLLGITLSVVLDERRAALIALASPTAALVLGHGQTAFLTASLFGLGLALLDKRPMTAGSCLGALVYKPQLGLMIAPFLLFGRHWRAILAAAAVAAALIGLSAVVWGLESWRAFFSSLSLGRRYMEDGWVAFFKSASLFAAARRWGADTSVAYVVQAAGMVGGLALLWRLRAARPNVRNAAACAAVALATPYLLDYDLALVALGGAFLYKEMSTGFRPYERNALAFLWIAPVIARPIQYLGLPLGPSATILLALLALRRASEHRHSAVHV